MPHEPTLVATIAAAFVLAFALGFLATRLRLPPLVGYLLAGVLIGPSTPGFVGDTVLAGQLAEIGVILLMFGVGLHFSIPDLLAVRKIALPGALAQTGTATAIGAAIAFLWGWDLGAALVFGLSLSVASTVVLLRALEQRNALRSPEGCIAVGWLIVEDLLTVLALVLLPALSGALGGQAASGSAHWLDISLALLLTISKVALFIGLALVVGKRAIPWLLMRVTRTGSRELFTLSVLAVALGIAYGSAALFDVSFALGAFFAGVVLSESDLSHQAAADSLPLQDAFAVLFFVSVGMLFDPMILVNAPLSVLAVLAIVMVGKSLAAFLIVLAFRYPIRTALTVSASLAQIGEFSFILAGLGVTLGLLPEEGRDLILAGALLSITLNPLAFAGIGPITAWLSKIPKLQARLDASPLQDFPIAESRGHTLSDHAILVGHGRVGSIIGPTLRKEAIAYLVIERDRPVFDALRAAGVPAVYGDASLHGVLSAAGIASARLLVITTPDGFQARRILEIARAANPRIDVAVRTHSIEQFEYFQQAQVGHVVMAEREIGLALLEYSLRSVGMPKERARLVVSESRGEKVSSEGL